MCVLGLAVGASAGIPDTNNSFASADNCGRFTIAPGGGDTLGAEGYTIHVTVLDINGDPVITLAATDLWLDRPGDMVKCAGGSQADTAVDGLGQTQFSGTIYGGLTGDGGDGINCDTAAVYVYALGIVLNMGNPVCVNYDSTDLNGDLAVTVGDFGKFAADFNCTAGCDPCHDYNEDGSTSVADFGIFGGYFNNSVCP
ncbi:MAG: hypothetical protein H6693_12250 [Candidatus Latescibacteria bacterium]|nr:hypothetical protein [Candidatus Latescibacterota bacterium]